LEEHIASIFRVKEQDEHESSKIAEDAGNMFLQNVS
jgi:hypothetical protein